MSFSLFISSPVVRHSQLIRGFFGAPRACRSGQLTRVLRSTILTTVKGLGLGLATSPSHLTSKALPFIGRTARCLCNAQPYQEQPRGRAPHLHSIICSGQYRLHVNKITKSIVYLCDRGHSCKMPLPGRVTNIATIAFALRSPV